MTAIGILDRAKVAYSIEGDTGHHKGRALRDEVRAFCGMQRNSSAEEDGLYEKMAHDSITQAIREHSTVHKGISGADADSELAADYGVNARLWLALGIQDEQAGYADRAHNHYNSAQDSWERAFGLATTTDDFNPDYRTQIDAHGSMAMSIVGGYSYSRLRIARRMASDGRHVLAMCPEGISDADKAKRMKACRFAGAIALARTVGIPIHKIKKIRSKVEKQVAGPYRTNND